MIISRTTLERWVSSYTYSPEELAVFRIIFGIYTLFSGIIPNLLFTTHYPASFYTPPIGMAMLWQNFPSATIAWLLLIIGYALCACLILGFFTRFVSIGLSVHLFACYAIAFSLGKINHNTAYIILPLFLSMSSWGNAYSYDHHNHRTTIVHTHQDSFVVFFYALTLAWLYCTAALPKIIGGWLNPSTHAVYGWFVQTYYVEHQQALLSPLFMKASSPILWECADWLTVCFECLFLWSVSHVARLRVLCIIAMAFHWIVLNTLNIPSAGFLICYLIFFSQVLQWFVKRFQSTALFRQWNLYHSTWIILLFSTCAVFASYWYIPLLALPLLPFVNDSSLLTYKNIQSELAIAFVIESLGCIYGVVYIWQWLVQKFHTRKGA